MTGLALQVKEIATIPYSLARPIHDGGADLVVVGSFLRDGDDHPWRPSWR
jgi:hypothetical protein